MEPVLLGLAAPSAVNEAGNLLDRTLRSAAKPFAAILHAVASSLTPNADVSDSSRLGTDDLKTYVENLQANLADRIKDALKSAGVSSGEPISLRIAEVDGRFEVAGDHPQKTLIESALAHEEDIAEQFAELVALRQLLAAADEAEAETTDSVSLGLAEQEAVLAIFSFDEGAAKLEFN
jgi:hypothetical protein